MTRAERRAIAKNKNIFKELITIIKHFFPDLIKKFGKVEDLRNQSYIRYGSDEILMALLLGYMMGVGSMRNLTESFNKQECINNIQEILICFKIQEIPHYDTINDFLEILGNDELKDLRTYMIQSLIKKRCFDRYRFLNKYWLVIVDATGIYSFDERHCKHCLTKTYNKGKDNEKTIYYHNVLEAKLVIRNMVFSFETEFIENEKADVTKQDCELKAFERLAKNMKKRFEKLPICILGDSLYACERLFRICKDNKWNYIIRFKEGSIITIANKFESIKGIESSKVEKIENKMPDTFFWANGIDYNTRTVNILEMEDERDGKKIRFLWLTNVNVTNKNIEEIAAAGRKRWKIENEGFNIQKNLVYNLEHVYSHNYNAMKNHYLLFQIAHTIRQLFENGIKYLKELNTSLNSISSELLESFRNVFLTDEDIKETEKRIQIRFL